MNINNFNEFVDEKILSRGYEYYLDGLVDFLDKVNHEYIFQVQGRYLYEVLITLDDSGEMIYSKCNCPYDIGPICKHEVAAFLLNL
ncbi:MAG: SWIM zinc finger domain-containing protein [Sedimentibacter sp.]